MSVTWLLGDVRDQLRALPSASVQLCITSPPYYSQRIYQGTDNAIGNEPTLAEYIAVLVEVFREVRRVLRPDGTLVLNLGDGYARNPSKGRKFAGSIIDRYEKAEARCESSMASFKPKDKMLVPTRVAIALQEDGWWLRSDMCWLKRSVLPDSTQDRPTVATETIFLFAASERYYYDHHAIKQAGSFKAPGNTRPNKMAGTGEAGEASARRCANVVASTMKIHTDRAFRTTDPFMASLHWILDGGEDVVIDDEGTPLAVCVNTRPLKDLHFAAFPPPLIEPFIRACTSEKGQCAACGAPWRRKVVKPALPRAEGVQAPSERSGGLDRTDTLEFRGMSHNAYDRWRKENPAVATGWEAGCACGVAPIPAVVLDPFGGAGTTSLVAEKLGRDSIYIDANAGYLEIAQKRLGMSASVASALAAPVPVAPEPAEPPRQRSLLDFLAALRVS